jgi:histidine ammonia-lyase
MCINMLHGETEHDETMTVRLGNRSDITLEAFEQVAWQRQPVEVLPAAIALMDRCHSSFEAFIADRLAADPVAQIYGITFGPGDAGAVDPANDTRPTKLWTAASFGEPLPERVVRGIVLARLANFIDGHAAARGLVATAIAAMLDPFIPIPTVPAQGNGGAGEILPLGHLFYDLSEKLTLEPKERMAVINGSPCAAALVADIALVARGRTALAEKVFALSVEALGSPLEAYSEDVDALWGDQDESAALHSLRVLLRDHRPARMARQSPVSHRILARVLGQTRRAAAESKRAAAVSLASVTDNPVYIPPDASRPLGTVFSTGGYHNAWAPAAIDGTAFAWADLCQLAQRHTDQLFQHPATAPLLAAHEFGFKPLHMVMNGWAEEAGSLAQPSLISLGAFGQNDVPSQSFPAWRKATLIGRCLDASLAIVATLAAHALAAGGQPIPHELRDVAAEVYRHVPAGREVRRRGPELDGLTRAFTKWVCPTG